MRQSAERGSAVVEFVLVGTLLTLVFISVVQLALILHVRNTLIDAAASGAHFGTLADRSPEEGTDRTRELIAVALNSGYAQDVSSSLERVDGITTLKITVRAPMPIIGLIGLSNVMEVSGHAAFQP